MFGGPSSQEKGVFCLVGGQGEIFQLLGDAQALNINEIKKSLINIIFFVVEFVDRPIGRLQSHDQGPNGFSLKFLWSQRQVNEAKAFSDFRLLDLFVLFEEFFIAFERLWGVHEIGVLASFVEMEHEELLVFRHEEKVATKLLGG